MNNTKRVKFACYTTNIAMSVVVCLTPILFITFRDTYNISYTILGLMVAVNFTTQLLIDLIFSFFSHKFNIPLCVKITPVLTFIGLVIYALVPMLSPSNAVLGLFLGTIIFSVSGGLSEVLISPVIAALPSEHPEKDMTALHSSYAWGLVGVIIYCAAFILIFTTQNWYYLAFSLAIIPLVASLFFMISKLPETEKAEKISDIKPILKNKQMWLCFFAIFLGGASENTMSQWCSGYIEASLGIPKFWGDLFGLAIFGFALGLGRTLYAKFGQNAPKILFLGGVGATVCYLTAAITPNPILGLAACALTGFCVSMLWPGSLIIGQKRIPHGGLFFFAMMAAGGDLGSAIAPQLVGLTTDIVSTSEFGADLRGILGLSAEQIGMKAGMLIGMIFPLISCVVYYFIWKGQKTNDK